MVLILLAVADLRETRCQARDVSSEGRVQVMESRKSIKLSLSSQMSGVS